MINFLEFTFQSFWHFLGVFLLLSIPVNFIIDLVRILNKNQKNEKDEESI